MKRHHRRGSFLADVRPGACWSPAWDRCLPRIWALASAALAGDGNRSIGLSARWRPLVGPHAGHTGRWRLLLPAVVERLKNGEDMRRLVAAAALANARTFGGQDYDGYHAFMASKVPAFEMSKEMPSRTAGGSPGLEGPVPQYQPHPAEGRTFARGATPGCGRAPFRWSMRRRGRRAMATRRRGF